MAAPPSRSAATQGTQASRHRAGEQRPKVSELVAWKEQKRFVLVAASPLSFARVPGERSMAAPPSRSAATQGMRANLHRAGDRHPRVLPITRMVQGKSVLAAASPLFFARAPGEHSMAAPPSRSAVTQGTQASPHRMGPWQMRKIPVQRHRPRFRKAIRLSVRVAANPLCNATARAAPFGDAAVIRTVAFLQTFRPCRDGREQWGPFLKTQGRVRYTEPCPKVRSTLRKIT